MKRTQNIITVMFTLATLVFIGYMLSSDVSAYHICNSLSGDDRNTCMTDPNNADSGGTVNPGGTANPGGTSPAPAGSISIVNPLKSTTIIGFLTAIIEILLIFAVPIIVFFIILAGFKFVTAGGNETKIGEAKSALTWAVIGGVIVLGAEIIIKVIQGTVDGLKL